MKDVSIREEVLPQAPSQEELDQLLIRLAEVDIKYGDGQEYNRDRIEGEIRTYAEQYRKSILETGKRLILLKEHEGHGHFLESLERLDIDPRTAQRMMGVVRKMVDKNGRFKYDSMTHLPPTKMYMLAALGEEDLDLITSGDVEGLEPEQVKAMRVKDLDQKLKELKAQSQAKESDYQQQLEVKDKLLAEKNRKLDELSAQIRIKEDPSRWGDRADEIYMSLSGMIPRASQLTAELISLADEIESLKIKDWEGSQKILMELAGYVMGEITQSLDSLEDRVNRLVPEANRLFHSRNDLRLTYPNGEATDV